MAYLMNILGQNFGELGEETALKATLDLMRFQGRAGENVDALLARFDEVSARAAEDGQLQLSVSHVAATIISATGVSADQFQRLLEPTNGLLPRTGQELTALRTRIRRMGHVIEQYPNNLASQLLKPATAAQGYLTLPEPQHQPLMENWMQGEGR